MKKILALMLLTFTVSAVAPAFAHEGYLVNCSNAPRSEWVKCIIDQSQDQASQ